MLKPKLIQLRNKLFNLMFSPLMHRLKHVNDLVNRLDYAQRLSETKNPFARYGQKVFSQSDEDGLTLEIVRRLGIEKGVFGEFGVGNGLENNSLILLSLGWRGFWCGGEELAFKIPERDSRLTFIRDWIDRDNVSKLCAAGLASAGAQTADVISLDLDGNDLHLVKALLEAGSLPKVFVVEYNAKFPPPIRWVMPYDRAHRWGGNDYFGASLAAFHDLFSLHGYFLVCCNVMTGANAFFVKSEFRHLFPETPDDLSLLYEPARYYLLQDHGHPASPRTIEGMISGASHGG